MIASPQPVPTYTGSPNLQASGIYAHGSRAENPIMGSPIPPVYSARASMPSQQSAPRLVSYQRASPAPATYPATYPAQGAVTTAAYPAPTSFTNNATAATTRSVHQPAYTQTAQTYLNSLAPTGAPGMYTQARPMYGGNIGKQISQPLVQQQFGGLANFAHAGNFGNFGNQALGNFAGGHLAPHVNAAEEPKKRKFLIKQYKPGCCGACNRNGCFDKPKGACGCCNCRGCCDRERTTYKRRGSYSSSIEASKRAGKSAGCC